MNLKEIKSERTSDKYYTTKLDNGLKIFIYPKENSNSTYAIFGTKFGSINTNFRHQNEKNSIIVPDGIAHYLEHKLFESEDGDAFSKYAKTGAEANAYTSFDMTCYLFSCTKNFKESLKILIDFVQSPYFTKETVQKEQGIIGQEIKMYDDNPGWKVLFNLLKAMYHKHPVKVDIAGTVQSIKNITPENLYECYNSFYNLNNMVLCIAGKVDLKDTVEFINETIKPTKGIIPECLYPNEPYEIVRPTVEERFPVAIPLFQLGFKEQASKERVTIEELTQTDIILHVLASKSSKLYRKLLDKELINETFGYEYFEGPGYASIIFSGESEDPYETTKIIKEEIERLHKEGISEEEFSIAKKAIYGKALSVLNSSENIANTIVNLEFSNKELFSAIETIVKTTLEDVNNRLKQELDVQNSSLSVILPQK